MTGLDDCLLDLESQIIRAYEARVRRIQNPQALLRILHRAWVQLVQRSAVERRGAPASQIVTDGYDIGWHVWGDRGKSRARYNPRLRAFEPIFQRLVAEWYRQILGEQTW